MPSQLSEEKSKVIYAEYNDVREELTKARKELSEKEGREISEAEFLRTLTLKYANARLKSRGEKAITLDPASQYLGGTYSKGIPRPNRRRSA